MQYITDPILRGPTLGCALMAYSAALVGVLAFLRRRSLLGESLSHATYPGVILASGLAAPLLAKNENAFSFFLLAGAFISAFLGFVAIDLLEKKWRISPDAALCFVLSGFFGIGLTIASRLQITHPQEYRQVLVYLYGQAATMTDFHIALYGSFSLLTTIIVCMFYKEIQACNFDPQFCKASGLPTKAIDSMVYLMMVLAIIMGIRSVGVILMSAMLMGPPIAARHLSNRLASMFLLAGLFGAMAGFFGNYLSVESSYLLDVKANGRRLAMPTGPVIVLVSSLLSLLSLCLAPKRGLFMRMGRRARFRMRCFEENLLKALWRMSAKPIERQYFIKSGLSSILVWWTWKKFLKKKWIERKEGLFYLSPIGKTQGARIVRLHRLWEVYLCDYLGLGAEKVHRSAEEMEHILTPELERELTLLLKNPQKDPHLQPIPPSEDVS